MSELRKKLETTEKVVLDKDVNGGTIVDVVEQTEGMLYTTVKYKKDQWVVMTARLSQFCNFTVDKSMFCSKCPDCKLCDMSPKIIIIN